MALIIAGERSGVGKTTVTLALLAFLSGQGHKIQSFKVGPDYIDPMFHSYITGRPCRNLDPVLTSTSYVQSLFARHSQGVDGVLIEGVMGLFDGITTIKAKSSLDTASLPVNDFASTAHIARLLDLPVLLVLDCSRLSSSVAAIAHGYRSLDPRVKIAGVVLNRVGSDRHLELLTDALAPLEIPIFGVLRRQDKITIPDRHLGLIPTVEIAGINKIFARLAELGKNCFDWEALAPLLTINSPKTSVPSISPNLPSVRIGVARDRAFNFYYQDNLDLFRELGAEIVFWSPMSESLPANLGGMYFGGGFPEVFAEQLSDNRLARQDVADAIAAGMPTYAECGGLMYLCQKLTDLNGKTWSMAGVLPTTAVMTKNLSLGYRQATALQDSVLLQTNQRLWGHEFHRSRLTDAPKQALFAAQGFRSQSPIVYEGWQIKQLHASYLHLHFGEYQSYLGQFWHHCRRFSQVNRKS